MPDDLPSALPPELEIDLLPAERLPWFKRVLARALGRALDGLGAQHKASWAQGHTDGYLAGHGEGAREGYSEGHLDGVEKGRHMLLLRDARPAVHQGPRVEDHLFEDWRLPLDNELKKRIKAEVAQKLPADAQPSAAQWKMILSDTPSTCVIAGAGSGKSTSLVLRIVLLVHYLGFELDSMTVVTFTRESRKDFIARLTDVMALWGYSLAPRQARELVRTFHSRILPMVRSLPGFEQLQAFETLGNPASGAEDIDSAVFDLRLNDAQRQSLNRCYHELYNRDERFRALIAPLYSQARQLKALDRDHPDVQKRAAVTELAAQRDSHWCDTVQALWARAGVWPIEGIEPQRHSLTVNGHAFAVHGYAPALQAWVVLGVDEGEDRELKRDGARLPLWAEGVIKRTLFQAFCSQPVIWLDSYQAAAQLLQGQAGSAMEGPGFEYRVKGELASAPLLDCFVMAAAFIENLGLDVPAAVSRMCFASHDPDRFFFEALSLFWTAFESHLLDMRPPVMTYNRMFALFGENAPENLTQLADDVLRPLSHLMIDEFQDVSPQIVSWLRASLREIRRRGPTLHGTRRAGQASLLCVGDDWQSIYGWRGSSPHYFMDFAAHFSSPATTRVMLTDNYRSHQHIIDAAEHIVRAAPSIAGKKARACGAGTATATDTGSELWPVTVLDRDDEALFERVQAHYQQGDSILLLYRKGSERQRLPEKLQTLLAADAAGARRIRTLSYHSAKGLQADTVFLLGDCQHLTRSSAKNQLYRLAGLGDTEVLQAFDKAQQDEALRLAYVAITRAVRHCYWFIDAQDNSPGPRASDRVTADKACFADLRTASN